MRSPNQNILKNIYKWKKKPTKTLSVPIQLNANAYITNFAKPNRKKGTQIQQNIWNFPKKNASLSVPLIFTIMIMDFTFNRIRLLIVSRRRKKTKKHFMTCESQWFPVLTTKQYSFIHCSSSNHSKWSILVKKKI